MKLGDGGTFMARQGSRVIEVEQGGAAMPKADSKGRATTDIEQRVDATSQVELGCQVTSLSTCGSPSPGCPLPGLDAPASNGWVKPSVM